MPYVQCEIGGLYCLAPKSACSRCIQVGCERGLRPKSQLCVVDRARFATLCVNLLGVLVLCVSAESWLCVFDVSPGSPFIVTRGLRVLHVFDRWSFSREWWSHSPDPIEACPSRPWGMADSMVAPVKGCRALLKSWGSDRWHCCMSCNSRRRQPRVTLVNLSHTPFTVRRYTTVKEVRLQWPGWLEQSLPCPAMVWGSQRPSCQAYSHRALEAWLRDGGSGEAALAPEPKRGRAKRNLRPRPRGWTS